MAEAGLATKFRIVSTVSGSDLIPVEWLDDYLPGEQTRDQERYATLLRVDFTDRPQGQPFRGYDESDLGKAIVDTARDLVQNGSLEANARLELLLTALDPLKAEQELVASGKKDIKDIPRAVNVRHSHLGL